MFNIKNFYKLKENNQLEVKQAMFGLPISIWETYSAFCNSNGGLIILGAKESKDNKLYSCGLDEKQINIMLKNFWDTINNPNKVSVNLLKDHNIQTHKIGNHYILTINVPKANKKNKPVYINNNPFLSYRRNHEGDYKCLPTEIQSMLRDQEDNTIDSNIIEEMNLSVINKETLNKYRINYRQHHKEDHPFVNEDDDNFLIHIGAAKLDKNGIIRPTRAGLLMFGNFYDIIHVYPNYFLDYQDYRNLDGNDMRWSNRIISDSGDWSGNLYDFFFRITFKLFEDIIVPFKIKGIYRDDSSHIKKIIREALCNTLSNADYFGGLGVVIKQYHERIIFSNPGVLAIPIEQALAGGNSQARNKTILKMFSFVNIGERAGSGIPLIIKTAKDNNYPLPIILEKYNPDSTKLTIFLKEQKDDLKQKNENLVIENENLVIQDKNLVIENENLVIQDKNLVIEDKNLVIENENLVIQDRNLVIEDENLVIEDKNLVIEDKNLVIENENLVIQDKNLVIENENLVIEDKNLVIQDKNLVIEDKNLVIENSNHKNDVKDNLKLIMKTFIDNEYFGGKDIMTLLSCSTNASYNMLRYLKSLNLIKKVEGKGKGKYTFKI